MRVVSIRADNTLRLRDGRLLGYAEYGDPGGKAAFYFHGFPGSRLEAQLAAAAAAKGGVRIIAVDRPGFGLSDFKAGRTIGEWPDDVTELAGALGIERFAVIGVSGGGPYVAACALRIAQRLTGAAIVSSAPPFDTPGPGEGMFQRNRLLFTLGRRMFWFAQLPMWWLARQVRRDPEYVISFVIRSLPESNKDRVVLSRPEVRETLRRDIVEAFRQGSRGVAWDAVLLYGRPMGFRLQDITMEVQLWHGEDDLNVPPSVGRYLASVIPNCRATFFPAEGHYSVMIDHIQEIQTALLA
jgi:pimeloyl-ACP methyl ester carboxylesterase